MHTRVRRGQPEARPLARSSGSTLSPPSRSRRWSFSCGGLALEACARPASHRRRSRQ
jgi:hypothetical protein